MAIDRFKRKVQSSETTFDRNATAFDVLQRSPKSCLRDSIPHLCLCLKLYLTVGVSIASLERNFSKLKIIKLYYVVPMTYWFYHVWWSAIGSIDSFYRKRLRPKTWFWRYHRWFCFGEGSKSSILRRLLIFYLPNTFVYHFVFYFRPFLKQHRIFDIRHIICNYFVEKIDWTWHYFKICYCLQYLGPVPKLKICVGEHSHSLDQTRNAAKV